MHFCTVSYNLGIRRQFACLSLNPISVYSFVYSLIARGTQWRSWRKTFICLLVPDTCLFLGTPWLNLRSAACDCGIYWLYSLTFVTRQRGDIVFSIPPVPPLPPTPQIILITLFFHKLNKKNGFGNSSYTVLCRFLWNLIGVR